MNSKSIGNSGSEKTTLMQLRIKKLQSDQLEEISDDDGSNDENDELEQESMCFKVIITMLDKMKQYPVFDDSKDMSSKITKKIAAT